MALTAEQTTQATQLSNGLPWIYPGASDTDFWGQYFSGSGPSLTPAEQASGISIGPMTASPMPTPAPAPQPQVLPGVNDIGYWPEEREGYVPPGAPVQYQSELIRSLREASPGFGTNNPGVTMLANPANSKTVIDFKRAPPPAPFFPPGPPVGPPLPPAPAPAPAGPGGGGDGGSPVTPGPVVIGPFPSLPFDPAPEPDVPDYTEDLGPPVEEPIPDYTEDLWPPVEEDGATPLPVPDPTPPDVVDLPPLPPEDEQEVPDYTEDLWPPVEPEPQDPPQGEIVIEPIGGGDRDQIRDVDQVTTPGDPLDEWDWIDLPVPDWQDLIGPPVPPSPDEAPPAPEYDEIPQGEIDVVAPGSSQPARDAIDQIGDITEVGDPLDEWDWIEPDIPEIPLPEIPPPEPEQPSDQGGFVGGSGDFYVPPQDFISVAPEPLDEWDWIELEEPEIPLPEIPSASMDFNFSDADLMEFLFGDFGGGGGGASNNFNVISLE